MEGIGAAELFKIIVIGIIEGITEWLPISSTGHILLFDAFLPLNASEAFKEMFFVVIQLGAILAVIVMFRKKMIPFGIKGGLHIKTDILKMWFRVAVACIPSAAFGLLFDDLLGRYFGGALSIAVMLIFYGILFIVTEKLNKSKTPKIDTIEGIDCKTATIIGLFQVLSLIPGTSRSGATIIGALLIGASRAAAAEFTFFLAVPTLLGASALKLIKFGLDFSFAELLTLLLGSAVAFTVSVLAVKFLMSFVKRHDFTPFGWYRIFLGIAVIAVFSII